MWVVLLVQHPNLFLSLCTANPHPAVKSEPGMCSCRILARDLPEQVQIQMPTKPLKSSKAVSRLYRSTTYHDKPVRVNAHFLWAPAMSKFQLLTRSISVASGAQTAVKVEHASGAEIV